jgi:hypothetical protein
MMIRHAVTTAAKKIRRVATAISAARQYVVAVTNSTFGGSPSDREK